MTILEDYHAFMEENEELLRFLFTNLASIRSWIEPAMFVISEGSKEDEIDEETIDFTCKYVMDKLDIINFLDESLFKGDKEMLIQNEKNITCLYHLSDMFLESYKIDEQLYEDKIQELEDELFVFIEENKQFDSEFRLKIEATMKQFLISGDEDFLILTNELVFEMANNLGYTEPFIEESNIEELIN